MKAGLPQGHCASATILSANPRLYSSIHTGVYHVFCSGLKTRRNTGKLCSRQSVGSAGGKRGLDP